jgi:hypothetical protein
MKTINNFKVLLAVIVLLTISSVHAVYESLTKIELKNNQNASVALVNIGDFHDIDEKTDARDKKILFESLEHWAQEPEKTLFILENSQDFFEANEKTFEKLKQMMGHDHYLGMYYALPRFAHQHNFQYKNIDFIFGDIRGFGTIQLLLFFTTICDNKSVLFQAFNGALPLERCSPESVDELFTKNSELKNHFFSQSGGINVLYKMLAQMGSTTIATLLQEIQDNLQVIATFRDSYAKNSPQYAVMNNLYENIRKHSTLAQQFIQDTLGNNTSVICSHLFLKALEKKQSFGYLMEQFHGWVLPLNLVIADAGFMMHILKNINNYKRIVIFSGNNHAIALNQCFLNNEALKKELNVSVDFQQGLLATATKTATYYGSRFQEQELKNLFAKTFTGDIRLCSYCNTTENSHKKLLRCTQCKVALYCNTTCQKNHWKEHKTVCAQQKKEKTESKISTVITETPESRQQKDESELIEKNVEPKKQEIAQQETLLSWITEHPLETAVGSGILLGFCYWLFKK